MEMEIKKEFKLVDLYDGYDVVGYTNSINELRKMIKDYVRDTDGECYLSVRRLNANGKYIRIII